MCFLIGLIFFLAGILGGDYLFEKRKPGFALLVMLFTMVMGVIFLTEGIGTQNTSQNYEIKTLSTL